MNETTETHEHFDLFTDEGLLDMAKHVAAHQSEELLTNQFRPKFIWWDQKRGPRLFVIPELEHGPANGRGRTALALKMTGAGLPEGTDLVMAHDSYMTKAIDGEFKKKDGTPWGPGDMERAFIFQTEDAENVSEALQIAIARDGHYAAVSAPYVRAPGGVVFQWDDVKVMRDDAEKGLTAGGDFPTWMREASSQPKIRSKMVEELGDPTQLGLTEEQVEMHTICAMVKMATSRLGIQCAVAAFSEEEAEIMKMSFSKEEGFGAEWLNPDGEPTSGPGEPEATETTETTEN